MFLSKSHIFKFCNCLCPTRGWGLFFKNRFILLLWFTLILFCIHGLPQVLWAAPSKPMLWASSNEDTDVYDPFTDYSEFDTQSDEEADLNFFRNGRLLTASLLLGSQRFSGTLASMFKPAPMFGFTFGYFFNLRFSFLLSMMFSSGDIDFMTHSDERATGNFLLTSYGLGVRYFFNTQNVYRSFSWLSPYIFIGGAQMSLSTKIREDEFGANDSGFGLEGGVGVEIPLGQNSWYIGIQAVYQFVLFKELEGTEFKTQKGPTGIVPRGDVWNAAFSLGVNF